VVKARVEWFRNSGYTGYLIVFASMLCGLQFISAHTFTLIAMTCMTPRSGNMRGKGR